MTAAQALEQLIAEHLFIDEGPALVGDGRLMRCSGCSRGWTTSGAFASGPQHEPFCKVKKLLEALLPSLALPEPPIEAIRGAAKLVESEARRWEGHEGRTADHWRNVATALHGYVLACDVLKDIGTDSSDAIQHIKAALPEPEKALLSAIVEKHYGKLTNFTHSTVLGAMGAVAMEVAELGRAALPAPPPEKAWQPIETADKDADVILLTDGKDVAVGGWMSAADQGAEPEEEFRIAAGWWFLHGDMHPTHWMPLPTPPLAASSDPSPAQEKPIHGNKK